MTNRRRILRFWLIGSASIICFMILIYFVIQGISKKPSEEIEKETYKITDNIFYNNTLLSICGVDFELTDYENSVNAIYPDEGGWINENEAVISTHISPNAGVMFVFHVEEEKVTFEDMRYATFFCWTNGDIDTLLYVEAPEGNKIVSYATGEVIFTAPSSYWVYELYYDEEDAGILHVTTRNIEDETKEDYDVQIKN